ILSSSSEKTTILSPGSLCRLRAAHSQTQLVERTRRKGKGRTTQETEEQDSYEEANYTNTERRQKLTVYKRGKVYWFELVFEGRRYRKSTKERNKVKAEGIAAKFRTALAERRVGIVERKPAPTFEAAMKAFLEFSRQEHVEHPNTYRRYETSSKPLLRFLKFKGRPVDQITAALVDDYKSWRARQDSKRTKKPVTPRTINCELACLKAVFFHLRKDYKYLENPVCEVELLDEHNEQGRILTFQE